MSSWHRLAATIIEFYVKVLTGDFNMSLMQVPNELKAHNVFVSCAAWTPWCMTNAWSTEFPGRSPDIGIDSCGIFMVDKGHNTKVTLQWGPDSIDPITGAAVPAQSAVADDNAGTAFRRELHRYERGNAPGQHWTCYCQGKAQTSLPGSGANFERSLHDLLDPATTQDVLDRIEKQVGMTGCGYLEVKQKVLDPNEWLVEGTPHNGAHFPLCISTHNTGHRSEVAHAKRSAKANGKKDRKACPGASPPLSSVPSSVGAPPSPPSRALSSVVPPPPVQQPIGSEASGSQDVPQSRRTPHILPPALAALHVPR